MIFFQDNTPRLCRIPICFCPKEVLEPLCPSKISQTVLFSRPILLAGGRIAQIWAESQFSPDFRQINTSATRCYLAGKPKCPRQAPPGNGGAGWRVRPFPGRRATSCTGWRQFILLNKLINSMGYSIDCVWAAPRRYNYLNRNHPPKKVNILKIQYKICAMVHGTIAACLYKQI